MDKTIVPFSLKDAPSLIEHIFPVQRVSAESYREQMAGAGKTLVQLGSYWKGRKPLILNRACILGVLLPLTQNRMADLNVFELLMGMDDLSLKKRLGIDAAEPLPEGSYWNLIAKADRQEEMDDSLSSHIWAQVNSHLGTSAVNFKELIQQLGIMRFGRIPKVADTFSGSGQIPFEAARVGCEVVASDLNPISCMLTWGAINIVGGEVEKHAEFAATQIELRKKVLQEIDALGIDDDGSGWRAKAFLYCLEVKCPQTNWLVPMLPSRIISYGKGAIAVLVPDEVRKRYDIQVRSGATDEELTAAKIGTVVSEGRGQEPYLVHAVGGREFRTKVSTIRGDFRDSDGSTRNKLRQWEKSDFKAREDDIFQERLYAINWMRPIGNSKKVEFQFRSVDAADLDREAKADNFIKENLKNWQLAGWLPDMRIEPGLKTDEPIRTRGWTHWHHLFPPRHLITLGFLRKLGGTAEDYILLSRVLNYASKLCIWSSSKPGTGKPGEGGRTGGGSDNPVNVFYNQALNTLFNYGCRASLPLLEVMDFKLPSFPSNGKASIKCQSATSFSDEADIFISDPPYGDAVCYDEILEYFIAWLRANPPTEFKDWVWDSRRAIALKGEDEAFRQGMVAAYSQMSKRMASNGIQIVMFTHQSGEIWSDMANIVWASGLQVSAAWYVVTETDSPLRDGSYVKGTVLLVLRKQNANLKTSRDDLAWEIQEEVENQVKELTGLNQSLKSQNRDENVFEDADLQMAGYAAALRVLTKYSIIDGRDMPTEAVKPRMKGQSTFVDSLIEFAVATANQTLVPEGLAKTTWDRLLPAERFILKLIDLEARGAKTLDNYQNFAKAFKVRDFLPYMHSRKANEARLKGAVEFGKTEMSEGSELHLSTLRAIYYAVMELHKDTDPNEVLQHLSFNVKDYYTVPAQRELVTAISEYLAKKVEALRPEEASSARVLAELVRNQRIG